MLICLFCGFSSGLPLYVVITLEQAWLRSGGVSLRDLGLFSLIQFPYVCKFLWAPLMDRFTILPLGRRRGWMLLLHVAVLVVIGLLGSFDPRTEVRAIAGVTALLVFCSASLDIVIDAFRRELLPDEELGLGTALHVNAYKLASLVPAALALALSDHLPWNRVFWVVAFFMLPGLGMTLVVREPAQGTLPPRTLRDAVVLPFSEFMARNGIGAAVAIVGFVFLYKLGDSLATALSTAFYLDLGFSRTQIGFIAKSVGLWASVAGGLIGGVWLLSLGINRALWIFGVLQLLTILAFAVLAQAGPDPLVLGVAVGIESFVSVGLATAAFSAFIARATDRRFTAFQFALLSAIAAVPRSVANAGAGFVVESIGWFGFFILCALVSLPGLLLLPWVAPWREPGQKPAPL